MVRYTLRVSSRLYHISGELRGAFSALDLPLLSRSSFLSASRIIAAQLNFLPNPLIIEVPSVNWT